MDLTVQHLRCFLAVTEHLSITRAAQALHLSPSSVSEQVSALERRLGVRLFDRTSRSVSATEAATALVPLAREAVDAMDAVAAWAGGDRAAVAVTVGVMASSARFRRILEEARVAVPHADWRIRQLGFGSPFEALRRHEIDAALLAELGEAGPAPGVASVDLWQERLLVAVREDDPAVGRRRIAPADLRDATLICGPRGQQNPRWFATILALVGGDPTVLPTATNLEEAVEMGATGMGVTVVNESVMEMFLRPGLAFVPLTDAPLATVRMHTRAGDPSHALATLVDLARRYEASPTPPSASRP